MTKARYGVSCYIGVLIFLLMVSSCRSGDLQKDNSPTDFISPQLSIEIPTLMVVTPTPSSMNTAIPNPSPKILTTVDMFQTKVAKNMATNLAASPRPTTTPSTPSSECANLWAWELFDSPYGTWRSSTCTESTLVYMNNQNKQWLLSYSELYGLEFNSGVGRLTPVFWSEDEKYLYLAIQRGVSGPIYFADGWGILRLDLQSGEIAEFLEPFANQYYSFAFSKNGTLVFIIQQNTPLSINVMDSSTGALRSNSLDSQYNQAGNLVWSPDQTQVAFCQATAGFVDRELFSLAVLKVDTMDLTELIPVNEQFRCPTQWLDEDRLQLRDYEGHEWVYDLRTGTLVE